MFLLQPLSKCERLGPFPTAWQEWMAWTHDINYICMTHSNLDTHPLPTHTQLTTDTSTRTHDTSIPTTNIPNTINFTIMRVIPINLTPLHGPHCTNEHSNSFRRRVHGRNTNHAAYRSAKRSGVYSWSTETPVTVPRLYGKCALE